MIYHIEEIITKIQQEKDVPGSTLYAGASQIEITEFEKIKQLKLPEDFKKLYQFCNGFECAKDMFRIIPLKEIIGNKDDFYLAKPNHFHFAEYMIYSDVWSVSINNEITQTYTIYKKADDAIIVLTNSLADFLHNYLNKGVYELYIMKEKK